MEKNIFKNSYDAVLLSCSVLKRLGSGDVDTFGQRFRSQKINYFAQEFGIVSCYPYNLYINGPYSPDLAHDLFQIKNNNIEVKAVKFAPDELEERFAKLQKFIEGKNDRQLEVIATLHWLIKKAKCTEAEAVKKIAEIKNASEGEIKYAFTSIKQI